MDTTLQITEEFQEALELIEKGESIFLTGKAGTGKSTLLRHFKKQTKKNAVYLAPTGLAAVNIGGQTIHSFFKFPGRLFDRHEIKRRRNPKLFQKLEVIIIDEVSMVRADMLDNIDHFLRTNGPKQDEPFGGIQLILIGDLFQLPPVVQKADAQILTMWGYRHPFFFDAEVWHDYPLKCRQLTEVFRQKDTNFLAILNRVRNATMDYDDLEELNDRYGEVTAEFAEKPYITLTSTNAIANKLNKQKLGEIWSPEFIYKAEKNGSMTESYFPCEEELHLKVGAQVIFCKNDNEQHRWVNGTIGKVVKLSGEGIDVEVTDDEGIKKTHSVKPIKWELNKYQYNQNENKIETEMVGSFTQFPLRLAWAITIHKSQGMTFTQAVIDMGTGAFAPGQAYVALSRCTTMEGIILKRKLRPRDIMIDENVIEFASKHYFE